LVQKDTRHNLEARSLANKNAFCSCVFSANWFLLHMIASKFPENSPTSAHRYAFHTWLTLFGKVLPCTACRVNFSSNLELAHYSPRKDLANRAAFVSFAHRLHDLVTAMLHKPITHRNAVSLQQTTEYFAKLLTDTTDEHVCSIIIAQEKDVNARFYFMN